MTSRWVPLKAGDTVDLIAPASALSQEDIRAVEDKLRAWGLIPRCSPQVLGQDILCANTDAERLRQLTEALYSETSSAVWCLRGGYGCTRLLPSLSKLTPPTRSKLFMGFSDITALHIFLQQAWGWSTVHTPSARQV